jgi:isoleucyl-tRNA synthetase
VVAHGHTTGETLPHGRVSDEASPLWSRAKAFVEQTRWIPAWGKNRIDGMLDTRPDWCISRQRNWGVPIPAFYDAQGKSVLTEQTVRRCAEYFRAHGADSWYRDTPAQILGIDPANKAQGLASLGLRTDLDLDTLEKGFDILDVWFESGASHHAVLECTHPELKYPADLYLEGSDQHRGWFQSTLLEAAGYKAEPPYKTVVTHGFVVDEKGRKMSKSEGNDIKVADALKRYGADVLRLWVASVDYQNDIPCGWSLFDKTGEAYRKIRNTIRYLLGNLYDFNPAQDTLAPQEHSIDTWMQRRVDTWAREVWDAYEAYEFHRVFKLIYEFCNVEISATYAKAIKDRLYCELPTAPRRRASQTVCYHTLLRLVELVAPVLAFTAEEAWAAIRALPGNAAALPANVHLYAAVEPTRAAPAGVDAQWTVLMQLVESGNKQLDEMKKSSGLGNALDAEAVITVPAGDPLADIVKTWYGPELEDALGVGYHRIEVGAAGSNWALQIRDTRESYPSCARSWKRRPDVGSDPAHPDLSARDAAVVKALRC